MEPIPESIEVAHVLERTLGEGDLVADLREVAERVVEVVPDCIGISLAWTEHHVTFTLEASEERIALFDALQYAAGGPCVDAVVAGRSVAADTEALLDEERWRLFAEVTASHGVLSTLTLPLTQDGLVVGSVNLYGASRRAFEGHHVDLAGILGASASEAVSNADLSFSTRRLAQDSPARLRAEGQVDIAVGILAARFEIDLAAARERLFDAAARAGVSPQQLADFLVRAHR